MSFHSGVVSLSPHITTDKWGQCLLVVGREEAKACSQVPGSHGLQCPQVIHQRVEPFKVFLAVVCGAVIPGGHSEANGQSHMGNQREEVASFIHTGVG